MAQPVERVVRAGRPVARVARPADRWHGLGGRAPAEQLAAPGARPVARVGRPGARAARRGTGAQPAARAAQPEAQLARPEGPAAQPGPGATGGSAGSGGAAGGSGGAGGGTDAGGCPTYTNFTLGIHIVMDVKWEGALATNPGTGKVHLWNRAKLTANGNQLTGTVNNCGTTLPDIISERPRGDRSQR